MAVNFEGLGRAKAVENALRQPNVDASGSVISAGVASDIERMIRIAGPQGLSADQYEQAMAKIANLAAAAKQRRDGR